jgi:uncharacterized protein (TIGR01777 family)
MKIAISGTHGLIGSTLKNYFLRNGFQVSEISRHKGLLKSSKIFMDLRKQHVDESLEGHDIVIHLAGASISHRWSAGYKKEILESRVQSAQLLVNAIKKMNRRPKVFFCASAVGYYGSHDPHVPIDEHSRCGDGFLAGVCQQWENASADLLLYGVRLIHMRFGVVLSKKGGALAKMLPAFYFCLGGRLGSGKQKMSWVALDEIPLMIKFIMDHEAISGPVNFVSPYSVTNKEFTKTLGSVIHRPTIFPIPGLMIKAMFGQMGKELLLEGANVVPQTLIDTGYRFQYPELKEALQQVL